MPTPQRPTATDNEGSVAGLIERGGAPTERSEPNPAGAPPEQRPVATENGESAADLLEEGGAPMADAGRTLDPLGTARGLGVTGGMAGPIGATPLPGGGVVGSSGSLMGPARMVTGKSPSRR